LPIPHLLLVNLLLGALGAWWGRAELRLASRSAVASPHFAGLLLCEGLLMLPLGVYLAVFYPDWSWLYLVRATAIPSVVIGLVLLGYPLMAVTGYLAAVAGCRASHDRLVVAALGTGTGVLLMSVALAWGRIHLVGTYEQYQRHFGLKAVQASGLGVFLMVALAAFGSVWVLTLVRLRREAG
jgi:hypothetical protein